MSGIILNTTKCGFRVMAHNFEIIIDPTENFSSSPDAIFVSNIHSFNNYLFKYKSTVFVPNSIINLNSHISSDEQFIIGCTSGVKRTLRKQGNKILDFYFIESKSHPESSIIILETNNNSIVYTSGTMPNPQLIPACDTIIINAGKHTPLISILNTVPQFIVEISDFSRFYEVIRSFNSYASDNTVGIDHTALEAACQYLKNNYTVFSKAIKPLSQYKKLPPVIITTDRQMYPSLPVVPDVMFLPKISLSEIYTASSNTKAKNVIAYCPDYEGERKRGKLIITGKDTMFEI